MSDHNVVFSIFLIFTGAAVLATAALYARQAIIVAYIAIGFALGPFGGGWVSDQGWISEVSDIEIIFLLFLLGMNMLPQQLWQMLREALTVTLVSSAIFCSIGAATAWLFGFSWHEVLLIGGCMMFSSTIIGLKLLPTTTLHHQHTGQMMISVLLIQDLIAIVVMLIVQGYGAGTDPVSGVVIQVFSLPVLVLIALTLEVSYRAADCALRSDS